MTAAHLQSFLVLQLLLGDDEAMFLEDARHASVPQERVGVEAHVGRRERRVVDEERQPVLGGHQAALQFVDGLVLHFAHVGVQLHELLCVGRDRQSLLRDRLVLVTQTETRLVLITQTETRLVLITQTETRLVLVTQTETRLVLVTQTETRLVLVTQTET